MQSLRDPRKKTTALEQHRDILSRIDVLAQALAQAKARAGRGEVGSTLGAALIHTRKAQRQIEAVIARGTT